MAKKLQLLRNQTVFENKAIALTSLKTQLVKISIGEPCLAAYNDEGKISVLLGIAWDANNFQVFEGAKISEGGELEIPEEIVKQLDNKVDWSENKTSIVGPSNFAITAMNPKDENGHVLLCQRTYDEGETFVTEVGNSLNKLTLNTDAEGKIQVDYSGHKEFVAYESTVEKNRVVAGNGIDVNVSGANTTVSVKLDATDKVLTLGANGLLSNLKLKYVKAVTEENPQPAKLQLLGKSDTLISEIDASDFVMDGMLDDVALNDDELEFTFNTESGKEKITIDLSKYIDVYTAGNGIAISGKAISAKVKEGDTILKNSADGLYVDKTALDTQIGDSKYKSALPDALTTPSKHGGLAAGVKVEDLKKKTFSQLFDDILFEEIQPTVKAPAATIVPKGSWAANEIYEVGAAAPSNATDHFTIGFDRGVCKVVGQPDKNRAGAETGRAVKYKNADLKADQKIELGEMSYTVTINHAQGDELLTSKGNKATVSPNPLPAGSVTATTKINGTYPYFCNGQSASSSNQDSSLPSTPTLDTKLPLQKWTDTLVGAKFASEASTGTRLEFYFPSTKNVTKVEFFNTVSGKWEVFASANYVISDVGNKEVQGQQVAYKKLTTQGSMSGALQLRFTVVNSSKIEPMVATHNGEPITDEVFRTIAMNSTTIPFIGEEPSVLASTGNRPAGVAAFAVNFEPGGQSPLDARMLVPTKADLIATETYSAKNYFKGMLVVVADDGGVPALYVLKDTTKITEADYSGWEKVDAKAAKVTAGNGITVSGTNQVSVKVKDNDPILEVTADGIQTKDTASWDCGIY